MRLNCPSGHQWDYLPNFPDSKPCPKCGESGSADLTGKMYGGFDVGKNYDDDQRDPLVLQSILESRQWHENMILAGDRNRDAYTVTEAGPDWTRPFGNDPKKREEAIALKGHSQDGY